MSLHWIKHIKLLIFHHFLPTKRQFHMVQINISPLSPPLNFTTNLSIVFFHCSHHISPSHTVFTLVIFPPGPAISDSYSLPQPHLTFVGHLPVGAAAVMGLAPPGIFRVRAPWAHQGFIRQGIKGCKFPQARTSHEPSLRLPAYLSSQTLALKSYRITTLTPLSLIVLNCKM